MSISALENLVNITSPQKTSSPESLRRAAQQFEAILLMQLTSAMNAKNETDEDSLFGGDGGTDLAKQMFSEQLATTMSQSGGVGLANMIMQQFGATKLKAPSEKTNKLSNAISAVKDIKENAGVKNLRSEDKVVPPIDKSVKAAPIGGEVPTDDSDEAEITSAGELVDKNDTFEPLMLDGRILNLTRPRIVPDYALSKGETNFSDTKVSAPKAIEKVVFQMPVNGRLSSGFGARFHPIDKKMIFHGGIDIAVPKGTPVAAAADGIVKFAGWKGGYGNAVIIEHADGTQTLYGHNQKLLVKEGQPVRLGEAISLSGSSGKSTGHHLHFEVRQNGRAVNPRKFLSNVLPKGADR